jgi:hypothetical protein
MVLEELRDDVLIVPFNRMSMSVRPPSPFRKLLKLSTVSELSRNAAATSCNSNSRPACVGK